MQSVGFKPGTFNAMAVLTFFLHVHEPKKYGYLPALPLGLPAGHPSLPFATGGAMTTSAPAPTAAADYGATSSASFAEAAARSGALDPGAWGQFLDCEPRHADTQKINTEAKIGHGLGSASYCFTGQPAVPPRVAPIGWVTGLWLLRSIAARSCKWPGPWGSGHRQLRRTAGPARAVPEQHSVVAALQSPRALTTQDPRCRLQRLRLRSGH